MNQRITCIVATALVVASISTCALAQDPACVSVRRSLTGEQPNSISIEFVSAPDPSTRLTAVELDMGPGGSVGRYLGGLTCVPGTGTWTGDGTQVARITFASPLAPGDSYTECIYDSGGGFWDTGQTASAILTTPTGPTQITAVFDEFYDVVTYKTFHISEATLGCSTATGTGFHFDGGGVDGWTALGPYDGNGGGPYSSSFSFEWFDTTNAPGTIGADPADGLGGSIGFSTPGGTGMPSTGSSWWIMQLWSPDLSADTRWQGARGFSVQIAEDMALSPTLYANLYVQVYDNDQALTRFFYNGNATAVGEIGWTTFSFDWSSATGFPTNYVVQQVFVNVWGEVSGTYAGGVYLDEVLLDPATTDAPASARIADRVQLHAPRPNPFNPRTTLSFEVLRDTRLDLRIYDVAGRLVRTLASDREYAAGSWSLDWNGRDDTGRMVASGVYVARIRAGATVQTRNMVLLK